MTIEKRVVEQPVYTKVQTGTTKVEVFTTSDGKEWFLENHAKDHQARLDRDIRIKQIKKLPMEPDVDISLNYACWYYLENEHDIATIYPPEYRKYRYYGFEVDNPNAYPGWFLINYEDGGDYQDKVYIYTEAYVKDWVSGLLKLFPSESQTINE